MHTATSRCCCQNTLLSQDSCVIITIVVHNHNINVQIYNRETLTNLINVPLYEENYLVLNNSKIHELLWVLESFPIFSLRNKSES